jgi:hypothetical protein
MLSTKDMSAASGKEKPVIGTGNHKVKINSISFDKTPYDANAYRTYNRRFSRIFKRYE